MKNLSEYLSESIFGSNFISVGMLDDKLIKDTKVVITRYLNDRVSIGDKGFDIADPMIHNMFDKGNLCKELRKLGWSAKTPKADGIITKEVGKDTMVWCFQLNLSGKPTDACIACWVKWNTPEQDDEFSTTYATLCGFDEKKQIPDIGAELFEITGK